MESETITKDDVATLNVGTLVGTPAQRRLIRIEARINRVETCLERDEDNESKVAELTEELEALLAEHKFMSFKVKKGA